MDKITDIIHKLIVSPLTKLSQQNYLRSISGGILMIVPFAMVASLFLFIAHVPVPAWEEIIAPYQDLLAVPMKVTIHIMGLFVVIGVAYRLAQHYEIDDIKTSFIALSAFLLLHLQPDLTVDGARLGVDSFFTAIIVAIITVEVARFFEQKPLFKNRFNNVPEAVFGILNSIVAPLLVLTLVFFVRIVWHIDVNDITLLIFKPLIFVLDSWWGFGLFMFVRVLVWFMGAHGGAALGYIVDPIFMLLLARNMEAYALGEPIPHIVAQGFYMFIFIGGGGATLPLVFFAMRSKVKDFREIGKIALPSSLFEINETVVYGLQMVRNPILMTPYMLNTLILSIGTFFLMKLDIIGKPVLLIPWTTPPVLSHFLLTGGQWQTALWGVCSIVLAGVIYYPFFKIHERKHIRENLNSE